MIDRESGAPSRRNHERGVNVTRTTVRPVALAVVLSVLVALAASASAGAGSPACEARTNNTIAKLTECVTLDGVRAHQAALQEIANSNSGIRASGTAGHDASAEYVADAMRAAGYLVTTQEFQFNTSIRLGPSVLRQTAPGAVTYVEGTDYQPMDQSEPGDVTAAVSAVDIQLGPGNTSTSGCEAADFAGFPAGNIALLQRGTCTFEQKAENASAAGAVGAIIFNQGNTPARTGLINGTLGDTYTGGIPVVETTYDRGAEWPRPPVSSCGSSRTSSAGRRPRRT